MKLIDKNILVTEIEKIIDILIKNSGCIGAFGENQITVYEDVLSLINTLEVKEMNLEKEIQRQYNVHKNPNNSIAKDCVIMTKDGFEYFAKHFFELGLRSTITEEDCKLIWNIGDEIPNIPEEAFFQGVTKTV